MLKVIKSSYFDFFLFLLLYLYAFLHSVSNSLYVIGMIIAFIGLCFWILARKQLGNAFTVAPQATKLVTHGLYSKIRNPIYVFSTLALIGLCFSLQIYYMYIMLGLIIVMQFIRAHKEEKVLEEKFGDEYRSYKNKTWF